MDFKITEGILEFHDQLLLEVLHNLKLNQLEFMDFKLGMLSTVFINEEKLSINFRTSAFDRENLKSQADPFRGI